MKSRVHEVAKELGLSSKEAITKLTDLGIEVKSHSSTISDQDVNRLKESMAAPVKAATAAPGKSPAKTPAKVAAPAPAKTPAKVAAPAPAKTPAKVAAPAPAKTPAKVAAPAPVAAKTPPPAATRPPGTSANGSGAVKKPVAKAPVFEPEPPVPAPVEAAAASPASAPLQATPVTAPSQPPAATEDDTVEPAINVERGATIEELAGKIDRSASEIIKTFLQMGEMKSIAQSLTDDEIHLVTHELGIDVKVVAVSVQESDHVIDLTEEPEDESLLIARAPIVTVMGHVDHGKSSILQQFRKKEMLSLEAGGITQAIGAYRVHDQAGRVVTFIDTPGHEAFTQMRARGAQVTDIAILVVAADDGVQPQTVEALDHAKAAGVPILVAVNKIDKPEADPMRVRQQLAELGLQPEDWGGDTVYVDISAKQGTNLDDLLEMVHLVADLQELRANPSADARGVVIEAHLDKGRGPVATLIVQRGTLEVGQPIVCGSAWCKVRAMTDEMGKQMKQAGPSQPVLITGWSKVPSAGDEFRVVNDDRNAKRIAQERESRHRQAEFVAGARSRSLEDLLSMTRTGEIPSLNLIVKADTQGAIEALAESIEKMDQSLVRTTMLRRAVGAINENDVTLAQASGAIVVGFNVRPDAGARQLAEKEGVDVRLYEVIYQLLEDIEKATKGLLAPEEQEVVLGTAEVRDLFRTPKGTVAGSYVTDGKITRNSRARLIRDGAVIYTGDVASLRRFKEDVREVAGGYECGIMIAGYNDLKLGDVVETFEIREVART